MLLLARVDLLDSLSSSSSSAGAFFNETIVTLPSSSTASPSGTAGKGAADFFPPLLFVIIEVGTPDEVFELALLSSTEPSSSVSESTGWLSSEMGVS